MLPPSSSVIHSLSIHLDLDDIDEIADDEINIDEDIFFTQFGIDKE